MKCRALFLKIASVAVVNLVVILGTANAHTIIAYPSPRPSSDPGNTTGPCGPYDPSTATMIQAGTSATLQWNQTIPHHGNWQIYIAPGTVTDSADPTALPTALPSPKSSPSPLFAEPDPSPTTVGSFSATVKMPSTPGTYTVQMFQVNTDGVTGTPVYPTAADTNTVYYYSCADIQLTSGPISTPTPTSTPSSTASCASTTPTLTAATFTNVNSMIIQPYCISCHSAVGPLNDDTIALANYADVAAQTNVANPTQSLIYELTQEGPSGGGMPPAGNTALSPTLESLLLRWIQAGAPNN